jgi:hypothetical protein
VITCVPDPTALGVYKTEQAAVEPDPASAQPALELNVPDPLELKVTVPDGTPPPELDTVTAHVVAAPTSTEPGEHATLTPEANA